MLRCRNFLSKAIRKKNLKAKTKARNKTSSRRKRESIPKHQHLHEYQEIEDSEEEAEGFSLKALALSHTYEVQPLGNLYLNPGSINSRNTGLGNLQTLSDELILDILGLLDGTHLGVLAAVSKSFCVFANHEPLWRNLVLDNLNGGFLFNGSWKSTYVASFYPSFDIACTGASNVKVRDFYSDYLFQNWLCANLDMKPKWLERDNIVRKKGISVEEFVLNFEEPNKPVLLEGCMDNWAALQKWDRNYLLKVCGDVKFAVGPVEMRLEEYFRYADQVREERPLYLFDPKFAEKIPILGSDFEVPIYFREDLFSVLDNERPDYRWIIIGPAGSGSSFHIDPNSTSAWNAVIKGSKKWILFPPDVIPPGVHPSPDGAEVACPVSIIEWFMNFYDATKNWKKRPIECLCKAGGDFCAQWMVAFGDQLGRICCHYTELCQQNVKDPSDVYSWGLVRLLRRNLLNVLEFLKRPNASELVSGTQDRVNLHDKFRNAMEAAFPGTINQLVQKAEEKKAQQKKLSFWDSVTDSHAGAFKFSF
ncbi:hypothetical protein GH714_037285 [Hevea brasiliensis]|uniref:JmjC domain-containing protein n=1 Tax=Hevea brasiliensis TaxID=3981 RepID=A0A6A6KNS2_HEVBR|nr:hypothetical protein GH714_037285 [Hevea brasiliensis]